MMDKKNVIKQNKNEITYNLINSALAGCLVLAGSVAAGNISATGLIAALGASVVVFLTKFKNYWDGEKGEYSDKVFNFI